MLFSFLADSMRDGTETGEEKEDHSTDNWSREENIQSKNKFGNHRRGPPSNTGPFQAVPGSAKGGWGKQNTEQQNGRPAYAGSSRDSKSW